MWQKPKKFKRRIIMVEHDLKEENEFWNIYFEELDKAIAEER